MRAGGSWVDVGGWATYGEVRCRDATKLPFSFNKRSFGDHGGVARDLCSRWAAKFCNCWREQQKNIWGGKRKIHRRKFNMDRTGYLKRKQLEPKGRQKGTKFSKSCSKIKPGNVRDVRRRSVWTKVAKKDRKGEDTCNIFWSNLVKNK